MDCKSREAKPIDLIINRLDRVKRSGSGWMACCPAHDDQNPSLSISEGDDSRVLLHCFAGCSVEEITAAIELETKDLFQCSSSIKSSDSKWRRTKSLRKRYLEFENTAFSALVELKEYLISVIRHNELNVSGDTLELAHKLPEIEHFIEILTFSSQEERAKLLEDNSYRRLIRIAIRRKDS